MSKLRKTGGYRTLASFQSATLVYDATYWFCEKFLDARSRTVDQMIQAARSGRQNIAEGSRAAATSSQTELRLVNVARASLEELLLDYEDYLRHRRLPQWEANSQEASEVRSVPRRFRERKDRSDLSNPSDQSDLSNNQSNQSDMTDLTDRKRWELYSRWLDHADPAIRANAIICIIHQANYLLDQQIAALESQFITEGGYSEQLASARLAERAKARSADSGMSAEIPKCTLCGKLMALRTAKQGPNTGQQFWGCTGYPECKSTAEV